MKLKKTMAVLALAASVIPFSATAGDAGTGYLQLGSNGVGLGYGSSINKDWAVRGQYNTFKQSFSGDVGDFGAGSVLTLDLNLSSFQVVADWYPNESGFRVSGGALINNNKININGTNATVGTALAATVSAEIKMSDGISPYIGIGYSTKPKDAKGFGFIMDLGVMFQNPKVSITAPGVAASEIAAQEAKVLDAVNKLKTMPVFGIGVSYSF